MNGVREFDLTCDKIAKWEVTPGVFVEALSYNGQVPGPIIRVTEGERVRVRVKNNLGQTTGTHWHGQRVTNNMDGVPFLTQPTIKNGETFTYEFVASPFGSHMYHSHHNAAVQVSAGLLGAFIVTPKNLADEPEHDLDYLYILNDVLGGFTINGKGFPATDAYTAKLGQRVRFRLNFAALVNRIHALPHQRFVHAVEHRGFVRD